MKNTINVNDVATWLWKGIEAFLRIGGHFVLGAVFLVGCGDAPTARQNGIALSSYQLVPTNVAFKPQEGVGVGVRLMEISFSVVNLGNSPAPPKSYAIAFYIDEKLASFDRETAKILPQQKTRYSFDQKLSIGRHAYRLVVESTNVATVGTNNAVLGVINVEP